MAAPPKVHIMLFHTLCSASLCVVFVRLGLKAELWPWLLPPRYTSCCFTSFVLHVFVCGVCRTPGTHHAVSLFDSCVFVWCLSDSVLSSRKAALGAWLLPVRHTSCCFTLSPLHLFVCGVCQTRSCPPWPWLLFSTHDSFQEFHILPLCWNHPEME